jgi:hypothetical protein
MRVLAPLDVRIPRKAQTILARNHRMRPITSNIFALRLLLLFFSFIVTYIARLAAIDELILSTKLAKYNFSSCSAKIIKESPIKIAKIIRT